MALKSLHLLFLFLSITLMVAHLHQADAQKGPVGAYAPADPKNPDIVKMGKFAVSQHNKEANAALKFITVVKAETQVVSGMNYRLSISAKDTKTGKINTYQAVVWSQPWKNLLKLVSFEQLVSFVELPTPNPGGYAPADPKNPDIVKKGQFAVSQHNKEANAALKFITVVKAETQVVNGMNYRLSIFANDTKTGKINTYQAVVLLQPNNLLKLVSFVELPAPLLGGYAPADPKNPNIVEKGKFAVLQHNIEANAALEFITVIQAETQVVNGLNYRLVIVAKTGKTGKIRNYKAVVYASPSFERV